MRKVIKSLFHIVLEISIWVLYTMIYMICVLYAMAYMHVPTILFELLLNIYFKTNVSKANFHFHSHVPLS